MATFLVWEGATPEGVRSAAQARAAIGARITHGWRLPGGHGPVVCLGPVQTAEDAAAAVLAAIAGADLMIDAVADREVIDRLCDDLRRLGTLEHVIGPPDAVPTLTTDERALLARLLAGSSLGVAAQALHLSRRTADRRLVSAKRALGTATTPQTLLAAARLGVTPQGP